MYTQRSKYWPAYTWKIQTSHSSLKDSISKEFNISEDDFRKIYFSIFDKINASFYHLEKLKDNEKEAIAIGKAIAELQLPGIEGVAGIAGVSYEPIGYEYESLLISLKSTLDFIAILIASGFSRKEDNIIDLVKNLQSKVVAPTTLKDKISVLLNSSESEALINEFRNSSKGQKSKRNFAAHKGSLPTGTINIPINNPQTSPLLSKAIDPNNPDSIASLPNSQNLVEYCEDKFYQSCDFFIGILSLITNTQMKSGPKGSVYSLRAKNKK